MAGGGTWISQNKKRPGVYINFHGRRTLNLTIGDRGTVAMALDLNWGPSGVITIDKDTDVRGLFGYEMTDANMLLIRLAMTRAIKAYIYRKNGSGGQKASVTIGEETSTLQVTALHEGTRGNDIEIRVSSAADGLFAVETFVDAAKMDEQRVANYTKLTPNAWVTFSGAGVPEPTTAGTFLLGGENGVSAGYQDALEALQGYKWNTITLCDASMEAGGALVSYIKRLREQEGRYCKGVVTDYAAADYQGIINSTSWVEIKTDAGVQQLTPAEVSAWVAGADAGCPINESLTYIEFDGAIGAPRYVNSEITERLDKGEFLVLHDDDKIRVEYDINSLRTYTETVTPEFSKNRVMRVLDGIGNDARDTFVKGYLGRISNDDEGRALYKGGIVAYMRALEQIRAVNEFGGADDVSVVKGDASDSILLSIWAKPTDSIDKIYMTVNVQ